ncbi:MAG: DNA mismatch repair protein MutS [Verrucomicrobiota bacterium]|nr:DNA mismatch repair protein MutS [Verrucomicrobiota bacterium]
MTTPMMAQWEECKKEAKGALLLFRLGDFYEAFCEDATKVAKEANLTLTARQGVPMCGIPYHTSELYIDRLLAKGHKVAIAEQMEEPKEAKGLVRREIVRIVTPGTTLSSTLVAEKRNNFFASVVSLGETVGCSFLDVTTGEFAATECTDEETLQSILHRVRPSEILAEKTFLSEKPHFFAALSYSFPFLLNEEGECDPKIASAALSFHLDTSQFRGKRAAVAAAGMLLLYLKEELHLSLEQVRAIDFHPFSQTMGIDPATLGHLELSGALLEFLDRTWTPMGGRLLSAWLKAPLLDPEEIRGRQEKIKELVAYSEEAKGLDEPLQKIKDLERLAMKVVTQIAGPRDLLALGLSLEQVPLLKERSLRFSSAFAQELFDAAPLAEMILSALHPTPPLRIGDGEIFREGFDPELDRLRHAARDSISWMGRYQMRLREETGIKTLKVGYTQAFGYYIEVSRGQSEKVPAEFQRRQTLTNAERFTTEELKQFEHQVLTAEERAKALESSHFYKLRAQIAEKASEIVSCAKAVAKIDLFLSLAKVARGEGWTQPLIDDSDRLEIRGGRHPIVERAVGKASFIANDAEMHRERQMLLITGPNMAGKSTYMRQVALIVVLAQMGSYVPAESLRMGVVDQLFSRIGASDNLAKGQSTFMVEMAETAYILRHATARSLVLLDEIGRGTSTYDGIAIAWAVAEFLLLQNGKQAKTLFATHYWELTRLQEEHPHLVNLHAAVRETGEGILFLRKMVPGGTDKSYGIHVAKLAGLPSKVLRKAEDILSLLEKGVLGRRTPVTEQLSLFPLASVEEGNALLEELRELDLDKVSPLQALQLLTRWKSEV